ncbi:uncharacterized protein PAC_00279 [Phialocephala subalpina]|uniref:Methyltransferase domain-containing protein n=1 Tax=Phialocephala subalpina TaxID=576137 RepID=A0A1L7WC97_9HELO|nr:uncharacterized protein PAC_00279 [Phialocephala subalpina]
MSPCQMPTAKELAEPERWDTAAEKYNDAVGRSSRFGADRLIAMADALQSLNAPSAHAIDLGAGTGSVTHLLADKYPSLPILATDISPGMLNQLMSIAKDPATTKITTQVADMAAPVGGAASEGTFSHVISTMAIQVLPDPAGEGTLAQWARLLQPNGVVAIGIWDFDENCGPHALHWSGRADLEGGLKKAGFNEVTSEVMHLGFDVGKEGFMQFFWESGNPMPKDRQSSFEGDLGKVKVEMERILDEVYDGGSKIPLSAALAVGCWSNSRIVPTHYIQSSKLLSSPSMLENNLLSTGLL